MPSDAISEYLATSKKAARQTPGGAEVLQAAVHQRWSVKTGADPDARNLVGQTPTATTIADLCALAVPAVLPPDGRSPGAEETVWQLSATVTGYKLESDGDYQLIIADDQGRTMIAEIPDPAALAPGSFFAQQIATARQAFDGQFGVQAAAAAAAGPAAAAPALVPVSELVTLVGLGFFDFPHGQDGVAPNAIELHPVIGIQFVSQAPGQALDRGDRGDVRNDGGGGPPGPPPGGTGGVGPDQPAGGTGMADDVHSGHAGQQHDVPLSDEEIALLQRPGAFVSAVAESSWPRPLADEPVTLVAVRRQWPTVPARDDPRSVLASWREDTGQPTVRAAAALDDHGFSRSVGTEPRPPSESYFLLPHAEAVLVRADPTRAAEAADLLGQDFVVTPDVVLAAPPPLGATSHIVTQPELDEQSELRWPERSGVEATHRVGNLGDGVVIGIFDTGCDADHAEFVGKTVDFVYVPPGGGLQRSVRGFATDWHGTHVAAISAGLRRGIAPEARLLAAGVIESESYESSLRRLATAMDWFQRRLESKELEALPAILNLSLGFPAKLLASPQVRPALVVVRLLLAHLIDVYRVLVVAAVGNDGPDGAPLAPAFFPDVLSVGAVSLEEEPATFSCGGPGPSPYEMIDTPDVMGYGVDIMSAMQRDVPGVSWYRTASGTSMAAPYVSGIAALVASDTGLQGSDLADHLKRHAVRLPHPPERVGSGLARVPSA